MGQIRGRQKADQDNRVFGVTQAEGIIAGINRFSEAGAVKSPIQVSRAVKMPAWGR